MVWTKEWVRALNSVDNVNKEYLFLIKKGEKSNDLPDFRIEKKEIQDLASSGQLELSFR
jgi:hypothetical protein